MSSYIASNGSKHGTTIQCDGNEPLDVVIYVGSLLIYAKPSLDLPHFSPALLSVSGMPEPIP